MRNIHLLVLLLFFSLTFSQENYRVIKIISKKENALSFIYLKKSDSIYRVASINDNCIKSKKFIKINGTYDLKLMKNNLPNFKVSKFDNVTNKFEEPEVIDGIEVINNFYTPDLCGLMIIHKKRNNISKKGIKISKVK